MSFLCGCTPRSDVRTYTTPASKEPPTTERLRGLFAGAASAAPKLPDFDKPEEWKEAPADQFSAAAFAAGPNDRPVRITVTRTPAAMGLEVQLNRWCSQLKLEARSTEQWTESLETMDMGGTNAAFVELEGDNESIVGAIAPVGDLMWFFKMRGPSETVSEELDRMRAFCGSVRFDSK